METVTDEPDDDRPPICPACGVTMGLAADDYGLQHVCLECGFTEDEPPRSARQRPWGDV